MTDISLAIRDWRRGLDRLRRLDRVLLASGLTFLGVLFVSPDQAWESLRFVVGSLTWIAPFLLLSAGLAAWMKAASADQLIAGTVAHSPSTAILLAAALGALSPFCSCGVIALIAGLLAAGMPLSAVMAFWLASPLMDPETFILMAASIGLDFTLAKTVAAFLIGLGGGFATLAVERRGGFREALRVRSGCGGCGSSSAGDRPVLWAFWRQPSRHRLFRDEVLSVGLFLGKWLLLAFTLESLMVAWLPPESIAGLLGEGALAIPLAVVVGVPAYLNGFAAIPLMGQLMAMGMAPGAALAFLIAGGITSIPAAIAVFALVRRSLFLWYLLLALIGSLLAGYSYQAFLSF